MKNQAGTFNGRENRELFYQYWIPDSSEIKASIVAIHGWGTHSDRMALPAEFLTEKGYSVFSFDIRGHWRNIDEVPGHIDSMDHIQKDIVLFMDVVKEKFPDKKVFLMGHSFGGLISLIYAINHPDLPGVLVSSPALNLTLDLSTGKKIAKKLSGTIAKIAPTKTVEHIIDQNHLTSDLKILKKHIADKHKLEVISIKTAAEIDKSMKWAMKNADKLLCPVFIMQAGNDKLVDKETTKDFFGKVKSEDKKFEEYSDFLHELWNERGRAQIYRDMFVWLEKHL
ncbi:MAG: alpha/beta fold hydrolase [Candidatus Lokiarchaeota archaeon]|nr:alpha/beta fold hydrolase [Candidatus Lokiarchaeota archaeon]